MNIDSLKRFLSLSVLLGLGFLPLGTQADEQLFGWVLGAETLPRGHAEVYQFLTLRTGKAEGTYLGWDAETEIEYGFTDQSQASLSVENHYFYNKGVNGDRDSLDEKDTYRFGGVTLAGKYSVLSPFKNPIGFSLRLETGYLANDEVDGLKQHEIYVAPQFILQKNFFDDTLITAVNGGTELAWGKKPAEQYAYELAWTGGWALHIDLRLTGISEQKPVCARSFRDSTLGTMNTPLCTLALVCTTGPSDGG